MKVTVIAYTPNPADVISRAAGCCYGNDDVKYNRLISCYQKGHMSVFEHASVTFKIEGISRACSHQLVRHRLASYSQLSQRYKKIDTTKDDWFVMPDAFSGDFRDAFIDSVKAQGKEYDAALDAGIRPEDARYLLPEATKTDIVVTMNYRELFHFLELRTDSHAQWEIRYLAFAMIGACNEIEDIQPVLGLFADDMLEDML